MLRTLALLIALLGTAHTAHAQRAAGSLGLGGQFGEPTGVTLQFYEPNGVTFDFLAAWDLDDFFYINGHGLFYRPVGTTQPFFLVYGPGAFVGFLDRGDDDDTVAGLSGTVGLAYAFERAEVYVRLTPRLSVIPDTDGDVGGGLGFRFYF
ncbi:MAG: hypothetical protein AAGI71_01100 [Bacteroidota bacterium]